MIGKALLPAAVLLLATALAAGASDRVAGPVRVIDADTFDVAGTRVRLHGIDAPEGRQTCGRPGGGEVACGAWATQVAQARFAGRRAVCEALDRDRWGRVVARCEIGGRDVGETLVEAGAAFAYRRYSRDYVDEEARAEAARRGVWGWETMRPEDWRRRGGA